MTLFPNCRSLFRLCGVGFGIGRLTVAHAVSLGHLGGIGLDLMAVILAPHNQPDLGIGGSAAERHR
jgi:hypothetical protein